MPWRPGTTFRRACPWLAGTAGLLHCPVLLCLIKEVALNRSAVLSEQLFRQHHPGQDRARENIPNGQGRTACARAASRRRALVGLPTLGAPARTSAVSWWRSYPLASTNGTPRV